MKTLLYQNRLFFPLFICISLSIVLLFLSLPTAAQTVTCPFEWTYNQQTYQCVWELDYKSYMYYRSLSKAQPYEDYTIEHKGYEYFAEVANRLDKMAKEHGLDEQELVPFLTAFVQQAMPYQNDPADFDGDYPKYPIETLVEGFGDCEDKAILLTALLNQFGFHAVLILLPQNQHMAMAVECVGIYKKYVSFNDQTYYTYIESTKPGWNVGEVPREYRNESPQVLLH